MASTTIKLLTAQKEFIQCNSQKALLLCGIAFGKSFAGAHFVLRMISEYPKSKGLITANTFQQLTNATIASLKGELTALNTPHTLVTSGASKRLEIYNTVIYLYSLEQYDNIRGIEVGWWYSDESAFAKIEAIQVCRGRLRDKNGPLFERHTSSPCGFNFLYDEFENKDGRNATKKVSLFRGKTRDNIFLPEGYYESLLEDYGGKDNPLAQQELGGMFVDLQSGQVYWGFNRDIHIQPCKLDDAFPLYIGIDFNISNMTACVVQYRDGTFYVVDEIVLTHHGANTDSMATLICERYKKNFDIIMVPDSTGKALKTSARGRTDIEILKSYGLNVPNTRNPHVRDRQNNLNIHFKKSGIIINRSCKTLAKEFGTLSSREKEGDVAHVSVALGYVAWFISPLITRPKSTSRKG